VVVHLIFNYHGLQNSIFTRKKEELRKAALCYAYLKINASGRSLPRYAARMHRHHHGNELGHNKAGGIKFHEFTSSLIGRIIPQLNTLSMGDGYFGGRYTCTIPWSARCGLNESSDRKNDQLIESCCCESKCGFLKFTIEC
jgi:hypothetical protein